MIDFEVGNEHNDEMRWILELEVKVTDDQPRRQGLED